MENNFKLLEEKLRENCCVGDEAKVRSLLSKGVDANAANLINGWTPLHWAAKRGHKSIVELLLKQGAVNSSKTKKGETPASLTNRQEIKELLGTTEENDNQEATSEGPSKNLPIVPNYIKNPDFIYLNRDDNEDEHSQVSLPFGLGRSLREESDSSFSSPVKHNGDVSMSPPRKTIALDISARNSHANGICLPQNTAAVQSPELVLKVRVANTEDFIEIELDNDNLTFNNLIDICCNELEIAQGSISKVRKLPNTIVRKDKDVARLQQFQELEIVQHSNDWS